MSAKGTRRHGPAARLGLVCPGLGHVLTGSPFLGAAIMAHVGLLVIAGVLGFPRLPTLLSPPPGTGHPLHAAVALVAWIGAAAALWAIAVLRIRATSGRDHGEAQWRITWREFMKNRLGMIGLTCCTVMALITLLTPFIAPFDPDMIDAGPSKIGPSLAHLFGTDEFGRDLFSRLLFGARISLSIGFVAVGISATFGAAWGAISGYLGGRFDTVMSWLVDLLLSLPRLVLVLTLVGLFRPTGPQGLYLIVAILGLTGWMGVSRIVRGMVLSLKEQEFIQASRAIGQTTPRIIFAHLLPNALAPVIVHATLGIGATILTEATLSFLGLGVPPPTATWGSIVNDGREFIRSAWWIATIPGFLIVFAVMSFNMLGDGLRDALDPKLRNRG